MEGRRFDDYAKKLASRLSRRRAVGSMAAGALAMMAGRVPVAAQESTPGAGAAPVATPASGELGVRRNGKDLSADERLAFTNAVRALKRKPSHWAHGLSVYDTFVIWHRDAFDCALMSAHMGPAFLPWHRQFLRMFEQELQAVEPTVTLPYWDWTVDNTADAWLWDDDFMGGNGDPAENFAVTTGPFRKGQWELTVFDYGDKERTPYLVREFGATPRAPTLPTAEELEAALSIPTYDAEPWNSMAPHGTSFRNTLEGWRDCVEETCDPVNGMAPTCTGGSHLHNQVHLWVAGEFAFAVEGGREGRRGTLVVAATPSAADDLFGTMAANTSLNDPVFWLHHTNIDRIWSEWMRRHGQSYLPETGGAVGHNIDDPMWPYSFLGMTITPRMMLDSRDLGYVYDTDL
jgi:tyrosinase